MKKFLCIALSGVVLLAAFIGCTESVITVTDADVQNRILYNKIHNSINETLLTDGFGSENAAQERIDKYREPTDELEVYEQVFRSMVINVECDMQNLKEPTEKSVDDFIKDAYSVMDADNQALYDKAIDSALKKHDVTKDEYTQLMRIKVYNDFRESSLKDYYKKQFGGTDNGDDIAFKKYIDKMVEKYK